ncbi:MAG TPA: DNA replication protein [Erysipelotrichaceae bacterium]|jgi:DNA replication protein DnaC|nr:DNA replication protein [Erysipelotrichaceae bacterium]
MSKFTYNNDLTAEQNTLCSKLCSLRMSKMAEELARQFQDPNEKLRTFDERVTDLINAERNFRDNKKFNSLIRQAHLKYSQADFDDSIYEPDRKLDFSTIERLEDCAWIDEKHNLLITGPSGAGKTYLGCAFGVAACHQFHKVRYYPVNRILVELKKAYADGNDAYLAFTDQLTDYDLLIIDDFGMMPIDLDDCCYLFQLLDMRDTVHSTMVMSQYPVKQWFDFFPRQAYADSCLRRLTSGAYRIEMNGKDMSPSSISTAK